MIHYQELLGQVVKHGARRHSRAGPTRSIFGQLSLSLSMEDSVFPLLTTRRIHFLPVLGELAAFLRGATDLATFKRFGCNYWDANAAAWRNPGDVGRIYGAQWRDWITPDGGRVDQLVVLIEGLRNEPESRRHILACWNPGELHEMCLPPCHIIAQFNVEHAELDCCVYMRSVDVCLGLPSDMVLYGALLALIAQRIGRNPRYLTFFFGDCHVYENHVQTAKQQLEREAFPLPTFELRPTCDIYRFKPEDIIIHGYRPAESLKYPFNV